MLRKFVITVFLGLIGSSLAENFTNEDHLEATFKRGLEGFLSTGHKTKDLQDALEELQFPGLLRGNYGDNPKVCLACRVGVSAIIMAYRKGMPADVLVNIAINVCILLKIESEVVCRGSIGVQKDTILFIVEQKPELTSRRFCAIFLQSFGCTDPDLGDGWEIEVPEKPTETVSADGSLKKRLQMGQSIKQTSLKVLHLSDVHYDPNYTVGSNANCKEPMCCRPGTEPAREEDAAGYWGDYRGCDVPWYAFTESLNHILSQHKNIDYVYYTGDIVDHKAWDTNIEYNSESMTKVLREFQRSFGAVKVFPILGNHEPHPCNAFSTDGANGAQISTQWVFDLAAKEWAHWLPEDTRETILKGGYYTVKLSDYRIIALNSNVCFIYNWWLVYDDNDPFDQLKWLVKVLQESEENGEKVHILSHVPTADDTCWANWGREYSRIVKRFSDTIVAQFNGHTHFKENVIFFDGDDLSNPVSVAYNGGSLTPYVNVNPNYVVYDVDPVSAEVQDYEFWIYDLVEANKMPELLQKWFKLYSFKDAYGANGLTPRDMADLAIKFTKDRELVDKYFRYKYREAEPAIEAGCDDQCHLKNLCYMVTSYHGDTSHCKAITELWNANQRNAK